MKVDIGKVLDVLAEQAATCEAKVKQAVLNVQSAAKDPSEYSFRSELGQCTVDLVTAKATLDATRELISTITRMAETNAQQGVTNEEPEVADAQP